MPGYSFTDYGEILLDHFENPRNVGRLDPSDASRAADGPDTPRAVIVTGRAANPACGDQLELSLRIRDGRVELARFRAAGCAAAIASSSMTTVLLTGMSLEEAAALTDEKVATALGGLPPAKIHCSVLAEEAVRSALDDYGRRSASHGAGGRGSRA
jgi:nitrogen fixation NifU-like protein